MGRHGKGKYNTRRCYATGKVRFVNEMFAVIAIGQLGRKCGLQFRHYYCKVCQDFHLSRIKNKKREKPDESLPN